MLLLKKIIITFTKILLSWSYSRCLFSEASGQQLLRHSTALHLPLLRQSKPPCHHSKTKFSLLSKEIVSPHLALPYFHSDCSLILQWAAEIHFLTTSVHIIAAQGGGGLDNRNAFSYSFEDQNSKWFPILWDLSHWSAGIHFLKTFSQDQSSMEMHSRWLHWYATCLFSWGPQ